MITITQTHVNRFNLTFNNKAGEEVSTTIYVDLYRSDVQQDAKITTTYRIVYSWQMWEHSEEKPLAKIAEDSKIYEFGDYFEADSKYQAVCLKSFANAMSNRQVY